jgi:hypothetical protein
MKALFSAPAGAEAVATDAATLALEEVVVAIRWEALAKEAEAEGVSDEEYWSWCGERLGMCGEADALLLAKPCCPGTFKGAEAEATAAAVATAAAEVVKEAESELTVRDAPPLASLSKEAKVFAGGAIEVLIHRLPAPPLAPPPSLLPAPPPPSPTLGAAMEDSYAARVRLPPLLVPPSPIPALAALGARGAEGWAGPVAVEEEEADEEAVDATASLAFFA